MKKILKIITLTIILLLCATGVLTTTAVAESAPTLDIFAMNLSFNDNVYILCAVGSENIENRQDIELMVWLNGNSDYEMGSEDYLLTSTREDSINSVRGTKKYRIFIFDKLSAKQMTDEIYVRACYVINGRVYYSEVEKYSILQYVYNMSKRQNTNELLLNLLDSMLVYGSNAQVFFDYKTDRLATDTYYEVKLENAKFNDGIAHSLFKSGEDVSVTAKDIEDVDFIHWEENGYIYSTDKTLEITVLAEKKYTAVYGNGEIEKEPEPYNFSENLSYREINNGTQYEVAGIGACQDAHVYVPNTYNGKPVTSIGDSAFYNGYSLTDITLPASVTRVGNFAFYNCSSLKSVEMSDYVLTIGNSAFYNCYALTSIMLPANLTSIGNSAFGHCNLLTNVTIPDFVISIGNNAFDYCYSLAEVTISSSVIDIGEFAFGHCNSMISVSISASVINIGRFAFGYCYSLVNINYNGTIAEWCSINKGESWNCGVPATYVQCSDGNTNV